MPIAILDVGCACGQRALPSAEGCAGTKAARHEVLEFFRGESRNSPPMEPLDPGGSLLFL